MNVEQSLSQLAAKFGIIPTYTDLAGTKQPTSRETTIALLRANGLALETDKHIIDAAKRIDGQAKQRLAPEEVVCSPDETVNLPLNKSTNWRLELEGSGPITTEGRANGNLRLPPLPTGLHNLILGKGQNVQRVRLICAPSSAPLLSQVVAKERIWGANTALYGLSSDHRPGVGSYSMLGNAGEGAAKQGADFIGINPIHAIGWSNREIISPYSPTHRSFFNSLHIAVENVAPQSQTTVDLIAQWRSNAAAGNTIELIDYAGHHAFHAKILTALFDDFQTLATPVQRSEFEAFCAAGDVELRRYAQFENLTTRHGPDWSSWTETPEDIKDSAINPTSKSDHHLLFYAWLQWIADRQIQKAQADCLAAGMALGLYLDLAVGARRDGAEAWCESRSIAEGVSIGAPPDHLSPGGQNWNLAALAPKKLAADNYRTFRSILQQTMRHCGMIRIDHVLGLNRSYWIPDDGSPGGYVKQNFETLMALVRLEATRSNTVVVGEDLGLVPSGFRETMNDQNIYSYGVLQYEKDKHGNIEKPERLRQKSLVCFGTHDTPTLAGFLEGKDIEWWQTLGWVSNEKAVEMKQQRHKELIQILQLAGAAVPSGAIPFETLRNAVYGLLAGSQTAMVSVQLDDVLARVDAQNLPGTTDEHPNWQQKYPLNVEQFSTDVRLAEMGEIMRSKGRGAPVSAKRIK